MTDIWEVERKFFIEADSAEEAQAKVERVLDQLDESEFWLVEAGVALKSVHETIEWRKMHHEIPGDITSYGEKP